MARLQYQISTMVQKDNSFVLLFWIFVLFILLVLGCGGVFYLIGISSFKDNDTLFPSDVDYLNVFDYFFAGLVVMMDTGGMINAKSILGRSVSFVFGLLGFGESAILSRQKADHYRISPPFHSLFFFVSPL
jgi:hypothetical protein